MAYTDAEIRQYIREVVREAKDTAKVETGFLKRSIKGDLIGRNKSVEFRQVFYGAYNDNSQLIDIAKRIMPSDIQWTVIFVDEEGQETNVEGTSRTGRKLKRSEISSSNVGSKNIKAFLKNLSNAQAKNSTGETDRSDDKETP